MSAIISTVNAKRRVRLGGVALPIEHGAWGFLFEPLVAAIAVAPSNAAGWIALLFIGGFLTRQPLKILLTDRIAGRRNLPQTTTALRFLFLYGAIFCVGLWGSLIFASIDNFVPLILVVPFVVFQVYCDVTRQSRQLMPELTGAAAISSSAVVIALAGGWTVLAALALWGVFIARLLPSILYVRNRLRLEKDKDFSMIPVIAAHFAALGAVGIMTGNGLSSILTLGVFIILLGRSLFGLSPFRKKLKAMKIGIWEVIYGALTVVSVIAGYYLQF